jgi:molybdopterin synthase sulfur carrier subunit
MRLVYFAQVRELVGQTEETLPIPDTIKTLAELIEWLKGRGGGYAQAMELEDLCFAINQEFAERSAPLEGAREIAFFPPVSGG